MGYQKLQLSYFTANAPMGYGIVRGNRPIMQGSLLSKQEFLCRGLYAEFMKDFLHSSSPVMMGEADTDTLMTVKIIVGETPALEQQRQAELDTDADAYEQASKSANSVPSEYAKRFKTAMEDWNALLQMYLAAHDRPIYGGHLEYQWFNGVKLGFEIDHLRSRFDIVETHLAKLLEPLKPAVVKLEGFHITNLQNFVGSLSIYGNNNAVDPTNQHYKPAYYDVEMFIHKLADHQASQSKIAVEEAAEVARKEKAKSDTKGIKGVRKQLNDSFVKEGVTNAVKLFYAAIGGLIVAGVVAIWHWFLSTLFR